MADKVGQSIPELRVYVKRPSLQGFSPISALRAAPSAAQKTLREPERDETLRRLISFSFHP
jgi:hypothetical protein